MSVTSSATVSQDREVQSPDPLPDKLLVVSLVKRDGTPLEEEEDIVELCVRRAHTRPLGVLRYSAADSVVFLNDAAAVDRTQRALLDITEFGEETIVIRTMAPTEGQAAAFHAMWHSSPAAGAGEPHTPPYRTPPDEETPRRIHAKLGDLNDSELRQLVRDLSQEIVQCESTAPPSYPPPRDWACPSGSAVPGEDDREVTFPGGRRVPAGPQPQPVSPAPAGPDMGQLISALTSGLQIGTPKISTFSGDAAPSKTEVSYEQWSHEVQCVKDHYPESVVRESIMRSLKGAAADMARYMGPTASVSDILEKLSVIFGTVASFDVLMQSFYKISQGNEKVPSFATRLEGTLNQIRIKCPGRIADHEVPSHLKDRLFHGVKKHVRDSVRYLYSDSRTTYSELVVAARRAESETEETKVKVRSAAATEVPSGSKELGDQIARLMAALTRAEQSTHSVSAPSSPRHRGCGRGRADRQTPVRPNSHNGQTALGQPSARSSSVVTSSAESPHKGNPNALTHTQGNTQGARGSSSLQCYRCQGWGHMARECATPVAPLNREGGTRGNAVKPPSNRT